MIVVYHGSDEVLITTEADERLMLKEYFGHDLGRDLEDYDRITQTKSSTVYEVVRIILSCTAEFE